MFEIAPPSSTGHVASLVRRIAAELANPRGALGWLVARAMDHANHSMTRRSIELLEAGPNHDVLEVGFGGGRALRRLLRLVPNGVVHGFEQSQTLLNMARRRHVQHVRRGKLVLAHGVAAAMPWPAQRFNRALAINTVYFWPDSSEELKELHRVLRPDGRLVLSYRPVAAMQRLPTSAHGFRLRSDDEVLELLAASGFEVIAVEFDDARGRQHVCVVARPMNTV